MDEAGDPSLRALERQLVEKALRDSRALLGHLRVPPCGAHVRRRHQEGKAEEEAEENEVRTATKRQQRGGEEEEEAGPPSSSSVAAVDSIVDRVAQLDAPCKAFLDCLPPRELAAVQQVGGVGWVGGDVRT